MNSIVKVSPCLFENIKGDGLLSPFFCMLREPQHDIKKIEVSGF